jgi:hypothetical protein
LNIKPLSLPNNFKKPSYELCSNKFNSINYCQQNSLITKVLLHTNNYNLILSVQWLKILSHVCWMPELWSQQRQPLFGKRSVSFLTCSTSYSHLTNLWDLWNAMYVCMYMPVIRQWFSSHHVIKADMQALMEEMISEWTVPRSAVIARESWDWNYKCRRLDWDGGQPAMTWIQQQRNIHCWNHYRSESHD